jgi:transcriptional regulator with XRE-family HTH domain
VEAKRFAFIRENAASTHFHWLADSASWGEHPPLKLGTRPSQRFRAKKVSVSNRKVPAARAFLAERVRSILESKKLTLSHVSQISAQRFGRSSSFFLPHTLYHQLRSTNFNPSTYQIFALSQISGYRFFDWFRVFGFNLEQLPKLQLQLPSSRTLLLDSTWVDTESWLRFPQDRRENRFVPSTAPLTSLVELSPPRRLSSFRKNASDSLYAKVGSQDTLAFPDLLPGSIVRVNPNCTDRLPAAEGQEPRQLFLIEHSRGLCCCRLRSLGRRLMVPVSNQLSYAQVELESPVQVRVLGVLDLEVRSLFQPRQPEVPRDLARYWRPQALAQSQKLGDLLRTARTNRKLSLRDISAQSLRVADLLKDSRYVVSPSALSDHELLNAVPRDFHKSLAVSLAYGVEFPKFLEAAGIPLEDAGSAPMPDHLVSEFPDSSLQETERDGQSALGEFMRELLARFGEVPFFLRDSIQHITSLEENSLDSWFWIGGEREPLYPYLENGLLVAVNRRKKRPVHFTSKPAWEQPVYMILKRDATYVCACCGVENGTLVIHPYSAKFHRSERIRYHQDAEIVGQIVAVARRLP